jgi:nucleotidyltransferase/DNA polymerase involved in DNA repair
VGLESCCRGKVVINVFNELASERRLLRKIIHVDMDAFYASVEQRDNPDLRGKPVAVGGSRERGVVATASYEARKYGVRSAMPSVTAKRQCPDLIFVKPRFEVYKAVSQQIRDIFAEHTPIIEPLSLDPVSRDALVARISGKETAFRQSTGKAEALKTKLMRGEITAPTDVDQDVVFATAMQALPPTVKAKDLESIRTALLSSLDRAQDGDSRSSNRRGAIYRAASRLDELLYPKKK